MSSRRLIGRPVCLRLSQDRRGAHAAVCGGRPGVHVPVRRGPWLWLPPPSSPAPALGPSSDRLTPAVVRLHPSATACARVHLIGQVAPPAPTPWLVAGSQARAPVLRGPPREGRLQPLDLGGAGGGPRGLSSPGYGRNLPLDLASCRSGKTCLRCAGEAGLFRAQRPAQAVLVAY